MDLERSRYQSGSEPELLVVRFSDAITDVSGCMKSPKSEWKSLAKEKAEQLGIDMQIRETGSNELFAAFITAHECDAVVAAMQPEWKERLLGGLRYFVTLTQAAMFEDPDGWEAYKQELCEEYDLAPEELDQILLSDDEAYDRHFDFV